jgi:hypothetical protein
MQCESVPSINDTTTDDSRRRGIHHTKAPCARDDRQIINGLPQSVLVYLSVLHDHDEILPGIRDELDIRQWIAVDQQ